MSEQLLVVNNASKHFMGLKAVDDVSLTVAKGEIVSIIGPNGAGKTTFFNLLTGQLAPTAGEVRLRGQQINSLAPHQRARLGMGRTFQIVKPLIALNALENVLIGAFLRHPKLADARDKAMAVLQKRGPGPPRPPARWDLTLSERRRLEVARALAMEPEIMLLDEVMAGLNQSEVGQSIELLKRPACDGPDLPDHRAQPEGGARLLGACGGARPRQADRQRHRGPDPQFARGGQGLPGRRAQG
jgi:branched-chain amino acid transport system ATP-binding protein